MEELLRAVTDLADCLRFRGLTLGFAESLTGGQISSSVVSVPGVSGFFKGAVVSYSNDVKINVLGVPEGIISDLGAVSAECAEYMAAGASRILECDVAVSATGIAGPDGGTPEKPVGLVFISAYCNGYFKTVRFIFEGNRQEIREQSVINALKLAKEIAVHG
ncbi:MAG: CinA family protein [Clostridiales bacterium]|nr:CinA family protein [Clostridiales bacterium]